MQSCSGKVVLWMSYYFDGDGKRNVGRRDKEWKNLHTFGFEEGRSATEIPAAIRLMAAGAEEWGTDLGVIACSMYVKQAFDNVSPESLSVVMKEMGPMLAGAILRAQSWEKI